MNASVLNESFYSATRGPARRARGAGTRPALIHHQASSPAARRTRRIDLYRPLKNNQINRRGAAFWGSVRTGIYRVWVWVWVWVCNTGHLYPVVIVDEHASIIGAMCLKPTLAPTRVSGVLDLNAVLMHLKICPGPMACVLSFRGRRRRRGGQRRASCTRWCAPSTCRWSL